MSKAVYIDDEIHENLAIIAKKERKSIGEIAGEVIKEWIGENYDILIIQKDKENKKVSAQ